LIGISLTAFFVKSDMSFMDSANSVALGCAGCSSAN